MKAQQAVNNWEDMRSVPRSSLCLSAMIGFDNVSAAVRLRDVSASGARVDGSTLPAIGASARISRGVLQATGTIVWRTSKGCGIRFDTPLSLDAWMPGLAARDQLDVDAMMDAVRLGDAEVLPFSSPSAPADTISAMLPQRLAEELAFVGRMLDSLGDDLCADPLIATRHAKKLQGLVISEQILGHVATLLVADRPAEAVAKVSMDSLRKRLQRSQL